MAESRKTHAGSGTGDPILHSSCDRDRTRSLLTHLDDSSVQMLISDPRPRSTESNSPPLESVRKHQAGLQSFRSMRRIEASRRNASALRLRFSQSLASLRPSKGAFDDPTAWKHHESSRPIGALDDFSFELRQDLCQGFLKVRPLIATIGKELFQERVHPEKGRKKQDAAIAILDIGRMNDGVQQQTQRVYENMALLPLDLFARVIAMRIDAVPPVRAVCRLWLTPHRGSRLACRAPCSRHAT